MGRPYDRELDELSGTYASASRDQLPDALRAAVGALRGRPLIVIGSGGSWTACVHAARLHETVARQPAKPLTPLEFIRTPVNPDVGILLLSASGRNKDIIAAARFAVESEFAAVTALSMRANSPLADLLDRCRHAEMVEWLGLARKDGFLATNSLLATCVLLTRAYHSEAPDLLPSLEEPTPTPEAWRRPSLLVLASEWGTAAAYDVESKWSESGLGCATPVDPRNFAHGRHTGLARRIQDTGVVALTQPETRAVTQATVDVLPTEVATAEMHSPLSGPWGGVDLVVRVLQSTGLVARAANFDPGRPRVPDFGRKLYRQGIPRSTIPAKPRKVDVWLRRKLSVPVWEQIHEDARQRMRADALRWSRELERTPIGAIVLDYDGTVCEPDERMVGAAKLMGEHIHRLVEQGTTVAFASGRGGSLQEDLMRIVPEQDWPRILLGLYNGTQLLRLDETKKEMQADPALNRVADVLTASSVLSSVASIKVRAAQVSIHPSVALPVGALRALVVEALPRSLGSEVKVYGSGHSVDVFPASASKLRVVDEVRKMLPDGLGVVRVGDQGHLYGNDAEFLDHPLGLSVDRVSSTLDGCWNIARPGTRRTVALLAYLDALEAHDGHCRMSVRRATEFRPDKELSS